MLPKPFGGHPPFQRRQLYRNPHSTAELVWASPATEYFRHGFTGYGLPFGLFEPFEATFIYNPIDVGFLLFPTPLTSATSSTPPCFFQSGLSQNSLSLLSLCILCTLSFFLPFFFSLYSNYFTFFKMTISTWIILLLSLPAYISVYFLCM